MENRIASDIIYRMKYKLHGMELEITAALPGSTCLVYMTTMLLRTGAVVSASLGTSPGHTTQCRWSRSVNGRSDRGQEWLDIEVGI